MRLHKRTTAFIAGASVLLIVIVALPAPRASEELTPTEPILAAEPDASAHVEGAEDDAMWIEQRRRARELAWVRDPFAPPSAPSLTPGPGDEQRPALASSSSAPTLTGVSIYGDDRRAVIDRQLVQEGDRLSCGYTVGTISARCVTLLRDQEELTLWLGETP